MAAIPDDVGDKIIAALKSDPQTILQATIDRSILATKSEIYARIETVNTALSTRLEAMDQATNLWHDDLVRVPTDVQKSVSSLRDFLEQYFNVGLAKVRGDHDVLNIKVIADKEFMLSLVKRLEDVSEQRFARIDVGLMERDKRADQLTLANSAALAAALAAQKEAAGESQKSAALAISKSEGATAEAIKAGAQQFQIGLTSLTSQVNDIKSRLDKGEGSRIVSDPATETRLTSLTATVAGLTSITDKGEGSQRQSVESTAWIFAVVAVVIALGSLIVDFIRTMH
jgi:hypothetical protein